jgi:hypothetical protein
MTSPLALSIATLPIIAMIWYFISYGFCQWWFTAGFVLWIISSSITKIFNLPIFNLTKKSNNTDVEDWRKERKTLGLINNLRAWITLLSVLCMACQFGYQEVLIVVIIGVAIIPPLLWMGRKYLKVE